MRNISTFSISEGLNKAFDFFRSYYDYILPFALILGVSFFAGLVPFIGILLVLAAFPLMYSIPYFAHLVGQGRTPQFSMFFEVYQKYLPLLGVYLIRLMVMLLCFIPLFNSYLQLLQSYNYDIQALADGMQNQQEFLNHLPANYVRNYCLSLGVFTLTYPLYFFWDFFILYSHNGFADSFKLAYSAGIKNYLRTLALLIISGLLIFLGAMMCGLGLFATVPLMLLWQYYCYRQIAGGNIKIMNVDSLN